jgi:transcriptional regulator with XRE-family HTH domain
VDDTLDGKTFAERLRQLRERAGKTRAVLGGLVGRSSEWVKALETGRMGMPGLTLLIRLAEVLEVADLAELTGEQKLSRASFSRRQHEALPSVRTALASYPLVDANADPVTAAMLASQVAQAWELWHGARMQRTGLATILPRLLSESRRATRLLEGAERREALALLAQVYHLAQLYLSFQPVPELIYLTSDRAMNAAQDADNPHAIAAAAWYVNHVYRDAGEEAEARAQLARDSDSLLRPDESAGDLALHGLLQLAIALSYAKAGRKGDAWRHHDEASRAARALGEDYVHPWLKFCTGMVDAYAITMHVDCMNLGLAVQASGQVEPDAVPSLTRQSFHAAETARAYYLRKDYVATMHMLKRARDISPDTFRFSLFARSAITDLLGNGTPVIRQDVHDLAGFLQLLT